MKLTNKYNLPDTIIRAIQLDDYDKEGADLSVTQLINSARIIQLRKKHSKDLVQDVSAQIWMLFGKAVHYILQQGGSNKEITEKRYHIEVLGWDISGQIDSYDLDGKILRDYKTCKAYALRPDPHIYKEEWEQQENIYAYMMEEVEGIEIVGLEIVAIIRDWSAYQAEKSNSYPQAEVEVIPVPKWSKQKTKEFIEERVRIHQEAVADQLMGKELKFCSAKERWKQPNKYALKKEGYERATKVFDSEEEAKASLKEGYVIEERKGKASRCEGNYCNVAEFCSQYIEDKGND
jgi:hypothetical protein